MYVEHNKTDFPQTTLTPEQEMEFLKCIFDFEVELWRLIVDSPLDRGFALEEIKSAARRGAKQHTAEQLLDNIKRVEDTAVRRNSDAAGESAFSEAIVELGMTLREFDRERDILSALRRTVVDKLRVRADSGDADAAAYGKKIFELSDKLEAYQHRFIQINQGIIFTVARRYRKGQMPFEDMLQEGNVGLIQALNRFDYRLGFRFSSYAAWWIRSAIGRALDNKESTIRVPLSTLRTRRQLKRATNIFKLKNGYIPNDEEMASDTGMGPRRFAHAKRFAATPISSLDQQVSNSGDTRYIDILRDEDTPSPYNASLLNIWSSQLYGLMRDLTPQERNILRWRFGLDDWDEMTLEKIGETLGLSRERIRQIQNRALTKLRERFSPDAA